jgi:RNA polymerase sigma-70 factor (ECF subfamily)
MKTTGGAHLDEAQQWLVDLFESHADAVFNVAYRVTWNTADAEDVVQESFVRAFVRQQDLLHRDRARPWLLAIAYRQSLMLLRTRRGAPAERASFEQRAGGGPDPLDDVVRHEQRVLVRQALGRLPEGLRSAITLRDAEGLQLHEVAEILDIGLSATKMRVARAREQLRTDLEGVL